MRRFSIFSIFSNDIAIDLGTSNTLVFTRGRGVVLSEPSIVAINKLTNKVEAVGREAKEMLGRTPSHIVAVRPLKDGVIADFDVTEQMISYFIRRANNRRVWVRPRIVIGVPSGITQVEERAVKDTAYRAKSTEVYLIEEAMAAAIGAGLPITEPSGNMIVDVGGGTTDVAIISPTPGRIICTGAGCGAAGTVVGTGKIINILAGTFIHFHTHETAGIGVAANLAALDAAPYGKHVGPGAGFDRNHPYPQASMRIPGQQYIDYLPYFQLARIQYDQRDLRQASRSLDVSEAFGAVKSNKRSNAHFAQLRTRLDAELAGTDEEPTIAAGAR